MFFKKNPIIDHSESGGVLIEFSVVLPICILFFLGIVELGRLLVQFSWIQQTSYNAAFIGSSTTNSNNQAQIAMSNVALLLASLQNKDIYNQAIGTSYNPDILPGTNGMVEIYYTANLNMLTKYIPQDISLSTTAPSVMLNINEGNLQVLSNPSQLYSCNGSPCVSGIGCPPTSCP